ncbi:MAG: acyl-CoA dehydrogenase family protein [Spirochaetota bacterium]|nr:acyl-CoA dehydrogenase family protein [Spirochaetota bacterium]
MDFNLSNEQLLLQKTIGEFTKREIEPRASEIDRSLKLPDDLINKMSQLNLQGMTIPQEYGGGGLSYIDCILAIEQISYSGTGVWWFVAFTNSIPGSIIQYGTEEQKDKYLYSIFESNSIPSIQFTEADTGSDPDALTTNVISSDDHFIINGTKRFSTFGSRDGFAIIYAKDEAGKCSAYIIEKNTEGYSTGPICELMGSGGIEAVDVYLDEFKLPKENILGKSGEGLNILQSWIADEKIQQCGACLGIAQAALDEAIKYSKFRTVRNKSQSSLPTIRSMLAEMYSQLEAARWLTYRTAFLRENRYFNWMIEAAAAKVFVVPAAMKVVELSRRIHGAYGYTREYKIERLYRAIAGASVIALSLDINKAVVSSSLVK